MPTELLSWYLMLPQFALVASRIGGLVMFQPVLGALSIPMRIRAMLVLALAVAVAPLAVLAEPPPTDVWALALACVGELLIGVLLGLAIRLCFVGVQLGGLMIAHESGLAFGQTVDPTMDLEQDVLGVMYVQLAGVIFLAIGGHRVLIRGTLETFRSLPLLGVDADAGAALDVLMTALAAGTQLGIQIAAPAILTLLLVNTVLGFLSRTLPQLNLMTIGFSLKTIVAFVLIAVSLPTAMSAFVDCLEDVTDLAQPW